MIHILYTNLIQFRCFTSHRRHAAFAVHQPQANPTNQGTNKPPATSKRASERVSWSQSVNSPRFRASACLLAEQTNDLQLLTNTRTNSHCHSPQPRGGLSVCLSSLSLSLPACLPRCWLVGCFVRWFVRSLADSFIHFNRSLVANSDGKVGKEEPSKQASKERQQHRKKPCFIHCH